MSSAVSVGTRPAVTQTRDRRCLVLGGCGFLGSVVTRRLIREGWAVRVFEKEGVDTWRLNGVLQDLELLTGDFMNVGDLSRAIEGMPTIFHFIGTTLPQSSMNDIVFDIETNVIPTVRLLELMRGRNGQRLIFSSSGGTVYGIAGGKRPFTETDTTEPICSYGISKLMTEKYIRLFGYNYGIPHVILRLANPYGESQYFARPQGAVGVFLHKALRGDEICIWGDGSVVRDYIYEADVASAVMAVLDSEDVSGIYNIGTGIGTSLNELLDTIRKITGLGCRVSYDSKRSFDVPFNVLDISRIKKETGWAPRNTLEDGLRKMLEDMRRINY